ncbi:hypothetical protein C438_03222 [Haloferax denitrificans ATCC 35960]|uniref:Uncharacterized protein n=1 Tax=Haloferax denitrificans ATCC 35960 TaxID=662478 RepID=M0JH71_9EURY|nr:hypothetical protein C438_03222 [Haloferax denitrificans ATCC 35960]
MYENGFVRTARRPDTVGRSPAGHPIMATLAQQVEQATSLGIFLLGTTLAVLSLLAWRRERDTRMAIVSASYAMFSLYGLAVFLEYHLIDWGVATAATVELLEHGSAALILVGLAGFFAALSRD